jgi:hypothetical protein
MLMHIQWNVLTVTSCYSWQRLTLIIIILWHISYYNVYTLEKPLIKRADQILPEVYGITLRGSFIIFQIDTK